MKARILFMAVAALVALLAVLSLQRAADSPAKALGILTPAPKEPAVGQDEAELTPPISDMASAADGARAEAQQAVKSPAPEDEENAAPAPPAADEGKEIRGRVVFTGGEPFPGIEVNATASNPAASPGLRRAEAITDEDGNFVLSALAPGPFEMHVVGESHLPIVGNDVLQSGTTGNVLSVDALLLHAFCISDSGEAIGLRSFTLSFLPDGVADGSNEGSTSIGWSREQESYTLAVAAQRSYMLEGGNGQGGVYYAYLRGDLQPGVHRIELRRNAPGLGAIKLTVAGRVVEAGARLRLADLERDGEDVDNTQFVSDDLERGLFVEVHGLVPGTYEVQPELRGTSTVALAKDSHTIEVVAGGLHEIQLETITGGRIELKVTRQNAPAEEASPPRGKVKIRRVDEPEWTWAELTSKRDRSTTRGASLWLDGTPATSIVLPSGLYRVRVTAKGYATADAEVAVQTGTVAQAVISLAPE